MTGNFSEVGRILDGAASNCWFVTIYIAICLRLTPEWGLSVWVLAVVSGYFHIQQAAMADYLRNFHLLFVHENKRSEFDDSTILRQQNQRLSWKNNFFEKLFRVYYTNYTISQERWTPHLQAFRKTFQKNNNKTDSVDSLNGRTQESKSQSFRQAFRKASKPMMKYTNILSFNTRAMALCICLLTGYTWVYFLFELSVMNVILFYMLYKYEAICKEFTVRLRGDD